MISEKQSFFLIYSTLKHICINGNEGVSKCAPSFFLRTKPRLSQAGALLLPKDFVSLGIRISPDENLNKALADYPNIELIDVKQQYKEYKNKLDSGFLLDRVMSDSDVELYGPNSTSGTITTSSNDFGTDDFYPASEVYAVSFYCRPVTSVLTLCTCKTEVSNSWNTDSGMASIFTNITLEVGLAYSGSGVCATLYFGTMDSNGGTATWKALTR